jgi:hypothetical protein
MQQISWFCFELLDETGSDIGLMFLAPAGTGVPENEHAHCATR